MNENRKNPFRNRLLERQGLRYTNAGIAGIQDVGLELADAPREPLQCVEEPKVEKYSPTWHLRPEPQVLAAIHYVATAGASQKIAS